MTIDQALAALSARGLHWRAADIPGLYWIAGYPELTTNQVIQIAEGATTGTPAVNPASSRL